MISIISNVFCFPIRCLSLISAIIHTQDDDAADKFCAEDIEDILLRRTTVRTEEVKEAGSSFSKVCGIRYAGHQILPSTIGIDVSTIENPIHQTRPPPILCLLKTLSYIPRLEKSNHISC
jgi:hypothetical protein